MGLLHCHRTGSCRKTFCIQQLLLCEMTHQRKANGKDGSKRPLGTGLCLVQCLRNTVPVSGEAPGAASVAWTGSWVGRVCFGEALLVLPHQQLLLRRHHLQLVRCCVAASCVLQAKEALQSDSFSMPLIHDHVALLLCRFSNGVKCFCC